MITPVRAIGWSGMTRVVRRCAGRSLLRKSAGASPLPEPADIAQLVRAAAGELPFPQAQALWLVDVCECSYADAAEEARTTRESIVSRVRCGRGALRLHVWSGDCVDLVERD